MNNRGQMTMFLVVLLVVALSTVVLLGIGGIIVVHINDILNQDIDLGQVNLQDLNDDTFGVYTTMFLHNADWWGLAILFGLIFGLFLSAYFLRSKFPKWGLILDIFMIIGAFIVCLYISSTYNIILDALNDAGETFLEDYVTKTSMFVQNLHIFVTIIGVIMMILFHSSIPKRTEENIQSGGFLQGVQ